jgi:DNA-directed RNA polymerase subunit omega
VQLVDSEVAEPTVQVGGAPSLSTESRDVSASVSIPEGITNPPIDELLDRTQSKYALVIIAAKRARQINAYYSQLGEGLLEYVGPLVETAPQEKPLSIALREINTDLIEWKATEQPA